MFPLHCHKWFQVQGGIRGMAFGDYGSYLELSASGGAAVGPLALMAGYRRVDADIHTGSSTNPEGVDAHFHGPTFSAQFR